MNIDDLPNFEPLPLRKPKTEEEELFYPKWHCFCCSDSGIVRSHLVHLVMPNYNPDHDKWVACQNWDCTKFNDRWGNIDISNFDTRFLPGICQKLDLKHRQDWQQTITIQIEIKKLASSLKMPGSSDRTENSEQEVQQRKAEIEAISPEQWESMRKDYLGDDDE
ncbi:hypothetical protein G7B40_024940 [Aetokthonos hydrillicola Thurmond2011]|jgi:hypothetical protein|uniref:Uncharacterized protein n=1 Tax=Aetokthonos hydrillicola Thurmond2011 TaxID=2712845 RepID=A0AAP5MC95_9CYAN|nr:hypothetical protein [Aetokthonos hydrillicola]MBO3458497.1 hypothetical protein [Aetokthonos hydrillicola CCALA 1050]MBW4586176.1 hypothetical protein [Aetokthonos hydrillicola CCALA 1050]MDR9897784.1 hypothetical protein [Aetokthonos hydrillicola Thurmond2011]